VNIMSLWATLTGSYPPVQPPPAALTDAEFQQSIRRAIQDQLTACQDKPIRWLFVSGQPQGDIVGIFARGLKLGGRGLPYKVTEEIRYKEPITLREVEVAADASNGGPLKVHISDPALMAESCVLSDSAPARYRDNPRELALDFARAFAEEARLLTSTAQLGITHLQIDAPTIAYGTDLDLVSESIKIIRQATDPQVKIVLHACGNLIKVFQRLLEIKEVDILNIEYQHLREIEWLDAKQLEDNHKQLALGCMPVNEDDIPTARWLERELFFAIERYRAKNIWGITPNCGLRSSDLSIARARLERLVEVATRIAPRFQHN
jgi:methionine synthase II (cobalamin-independent)